MKKFIIAFVLLFSGSSLFASECALKDMNLNNLKSPEGFDLEYSIQVPFPPKLMEILEKYFGKFSKENCKNSIVVTKITNKKTSEYYLAFYTNENRCDGGNSYGVVFKGTDLQSQVPVATIEDSYVDCL
jgi:hypothetical protein